MKEVNDYLENKYPILWDGVRMRVKFDEYAIGHRTRITLVSWDEEFQSEVPYLIATVNDPALSLDDNEVIIKDYSENEGVLKLLIKNDIVYASHDKVQLGHVYGYVCQLKERDDA